MASSQTPALASGKGNETTKSATPLCDLKDHFPYHRQEIKGIYRDVTAWLSGLESTDAAFMTQVFELRLKFIALRNELFEVIDICEQTRKSGMEMR